MPSCEQPGELLEPAGTVLLTVERQQGVVGPDSALPELARAARSSGAPRHVARLVAAAHRNGVQVTHAVAERRPDGRGAGRNTRLFAGVPADHTAAVLRHTLALVATVTTTDEVLDRLGRPR